MEPFVKTESNGTEFFVLHPWMEANTRLSAGITSRRGGVSQSEFASLNCGLHVRDDTDSVLANRKRIADRLDIPLQEWTYAEQVHHNEVAMITARERGRGSVSLGDAIEGADALITDTPNICLAAIYADCVPLYFHDPTHHAIGLAHAGWKGTASGICDAVIERMRQAFGTEPEQLRCAIGPSIGECCYEVDGPVIERMKTAIETGDEGEGVFRRTDNGKYHLDLKQINRRMMLKAGVSSDHIELSTLCTSCFSDDFYSYRKEGGRTGRMAAWIRLEDQLGKEMSMS